ncbi:MBL fold metallo-hydrolase [Aeromicrobium sp. REDSEA-S38_B2]|jgi:glyoxylase-like metal-dependent hydrolase (beta-lactamase superfamily II)|uniref:MBL fold metallo-hydrolase n=1 Tax=Aeromicrobium sp. REDSEA-S38_B2 TaxID=1811528 RepID=UPI000A9B7C49|nr:MBL fold metallo-hydrolase [Aeromicrobium sp. REDSEA-S38_B2]
MTSPIQVADGVHLATGTDVNWLLLQDGDALTVIDTGYPGDADRLDASVRALGREPGDVAAVLVTHAHVDHVGSIERWWQEHGVPVLVHEDELANVRGERHESATPLDVARRAWRPRTALWAARITRAGGTAHVTAPHAQTWTGEGPLDLPGRPVPVHTPGHTSGHTAFLLADAGVLVTGDAIVTAHATTSRRGPQQLPGFFATDPTLAARSLERFRDLDVDTIAPGHGPVWQGRPTDAVDHALAPQR